MNAARIEAGTATRGRSEARQPPSRATVSGIAAIATTASAKAAIRIQYTSRMGSGP